MNEEIFNTTIRQFLKKVGVTSQREIEKAVRDGIESGKLQGNESFPATMTLQVGKLDLTLRIEGEIDLS